MRQLNKELISGAIGMIVAGISVSLFGVIDTLKGLLLLGTATVVIYFVTVLIKAMVALAELLKGETEE